MSDNKENHFTKPEHAMPSAPAGNASNPSPNDESVRQVNNDQLLDSQAEKYLRESASIEDMPDPQEQKEADEAIKNEGKNQS